MTTMAQTTVRMAKAAKRIEKPRPLKISQQSRPSPADGPARLNTVEEIMALVEHVSDVLKEGSWDATLLLNIVYLCKHLKTYGQHLETIYKDQLDRAFINFRNGSRDDRLDNLSRTCLLEIIELRATNWQGGDDILAYYKLKTNVDVVPPPPDTPTLMQPLLVQTPSPTAPQPPMLSPGEVIKNSGKFAKPTKIPGKNYCKDEVVIRNSDSGKVMGIKGRRVHMIEELSETIISFQRVSPGAKERLVQITGPSEESINHAKQLMEETIRRNASPIRLEQPDKEGGGSSSSLNSSASDESNRFASGIRRNLSHSLSTNDAHLREYKHTVTLGNRSIKIIGSDMELVTMAKWLLDEHLTLQKAAEYDAAYRGKMSISASVVPETVSPLSSSAMVNFEIQGAQAPPKLSSRSQVNSEDSNATSESEETYKVTASSTTTTSTTSTTITSTSEPVAIIPSVTTTDASNVQLTVVRQPLFPDSPKEAFNAAEESDGTGAVSARNRRAFFAHTNQSTQQQAKESAASITHAETSRTYSREELLDIALLPLSEVRPKGWDIIQLYGIAKKAVELFDPVVYVQKWKEMDGSCAVISATDIDPADLE